MEKTLSPGKHKVKSNFRDSWELLSHLGDGLRRDLWLKMCTVPLLSLGGYDSQTYIHNLALLTLSPDQINNYQWQGKNGQKIPCVHTHLCGRVPQHFRSWAIRTNW